jgi:transcriptional regulator GlxA family with amidase domain
VAESCAVNLVDLRGELIRALARRLVEADCGLREYLEVARRLKSIGQVMNGSADGLSTSTGPGQDAEADRLFDLLVERADRATRMQIPSLSAIAAQIGVREREINRCLRLITKMSFRGVCRALTVRRGLRMLAGTNNQIRQIAFALGYEHHSQFDRDLRAVMGMSPKCFRLLIG